MAACAQPPYAAPAFEPSSAPSHESPSSATFGVSIAFTSTAAAAPDRPFDLLELQKLLARTFESFFERPAPGAKEDGGWSSRRRSINRRAAPTAEGWISTP
jgi:hypothetical protein